MPGTHHLFSITRGLLRLATWLSIALAALLVVVTGAIEMAAVGALTLPIPAEVTDTMKGVPVSHVLTAAAIAVTGATICIALVAWMLVLTTRIVDTASAGDPFVAKNADRLNHIACLLLAIQAVGFVIGTVINMFPDPVREKVSFGFDISATGILAALLLFVLAQIFRRGSEMRAELEGTV